MAWLLACIQPPDPSTWTGLPAGDGWPDEAGEPIPAPGGLDAPWLEDVAAYGRDELPSGRADAGSFGVGNGQVFGMIGLDDPVNTLTNAIGPGYDADAGFFGDSAFLLDTEVTDARVQRVRGTAIVRTWEAGDGAELSTTSFAAPDDPVLVRLVTVSATRAGAVRWSIARADDEDPSTDELTQTRGSRRTRLTCETGSLIDDGWEIPFEAGEATIQIGRAHV